MKKLLLVVLALFTLAIESKESKEQFCNVLIKKITPACFGEETGKIKFCVDGNTAPYKAVLKSATPGSSFKPRKITDIPNKATLAFENLPADTYILSLTSKCCSKVIADIVVTQPTEIKVQVLAITPAFLDFATGAISFTVTGGTPLYTAELFNSTSPQPVQTITEIEEGMKQIFMNLVADTYRIVITDAHGCMQIDPGIIVPSSPVVVKVVEPVTPTCFGQKSGTIPFTPSGGFAPYTAYLFMLVNNVLVEVQKIEGIGEGETAIFMDLGPGSYDICVVDSRSNRACLLNNAVVVELSQLIVTLGQVTQAPPGASTGSISFTVSGSEAPYVVQLFNNTSPQALQTLSIAQSGGTGTFTGLPAGTYSIVATDANGCMVTDPGITVTNSLIEYIRDKYC